MSTTVGLWCYWRYQLCYIFKKNTKRLSVSNHDKDLDQICWGSSSQCIVLEQNDTCSQHTSPPFSQGLSASSKGVSVLKQSRVYNINESTDWLIAWLVTAVIHVVQSTLFKLLVASQSANLTEVMQDIHVGNAKLVYGFTDMTEFSCKQKSMRSIWLTSMNCFAVSSSARNQLPAAMHVCSLAVSSVCVCMMSFTSASTFMAMCAPWFICFLAAASLSSPWSRQAGH